MTDTENRSIHGPKRDYDIQRIEFSQMPLAAQKALEERLEWCRNSDGSDTKNFDSVFELDSKDGVISYAGVFTFSDEDKPEQMIQLVDIKEGESAGWGAARLVFLDDALFKDQPYVYYTHTLEKHQKQGLAMRRLRALNTLTKDVWKLPLKSSPVVTPVAKRRWEKLYEMGEVEKWGKNKTDYRFK